MLELKININSICGIIKEYQTKYIFIKKNAPELVSEFTPEMWWITRNKKDYKPSEIPVVLPEEYLNIINTN